MPPKGGETEERRISMNTFTKADILLPQNVELEKWSTIACDQYTSEPEYWEKVREYVGEAPSALKVTFPEVYLSGDDTQKRISGINAEMKKYLDDGIFKEYKNCMIYVERTLSDGRVRKGVVGKLDLEDYDFSKNSGSLVRATEGTVLERIPPRVKIRENAPLELPHIMILIDDADKKVIEPIAGIKDKLEKVYDFDLMMNGGHITGRLLDDELCDRVCAGLEKLSIEFMSKYNMIEAPELIFAVGDGNHSLAAAKTCWENIKKTLSPEEIETHPARFALCEIVNLHDDALEFEPIHRVLFGVDKDKLFEELNKFYNISMMNNGGQVFEYVCNGERGEIYVANPSSSLTVGTLQNFLDYYIDKFGGKIDYIHGEDAVLKLASQKGNVGFILPGISKNQLFPTVISDGALPRKTFSMGEADEKRFYLEAKKIR